jgi:hypothetical protein
LVTIFHTMRRSLIFLFATVPASMLFAQTALQWDPVLDVGVTGQGYLRPRLALNAEQRPVVLWGRSSPEANFVAVGNGAAFSAPVLLQPAGVLPSVADWMGSSIASDGYNMWAVFKALPEDVAPCYVVRSTDGGSTWGDTVRVDPLDTLVSRFPSIALNANGPIVQYMQFTSGYSEPRQVVQSMVSGTFAPPAQVSTPFASGEVCDCCPGQVVAEGDRVVALYRNAGTNTRVMWGASSMNGGLDFPVGGQLDPTDWNLDVCPSSGPAAFLDGDSLRYVWMSGADNGYKVYFGSAAADDLSLGAWGLVHSEQAQGLSQNFPRIAGHGDTLGVVWQQSFGSQTEVLFSWSVTGFSGLSAPDTVNTVLQGAQRTPDIAFVNGAFHIVWSDALGGTVRYRKATLVEATGVRELARPEVLHVWPSPANDLVQLRSVGASPLAIRLMDATGRVVLDLSGRTTAFDVSAFEDGAYRLLALDADAKILASVALVIVH